VELHKQAVDTTQGAVEAIHDAEQQLINDLSRTEGAIRGHLLFMAAAAAQSAAIRNQITSQTISGFQTANQTAFPGRQRGGTFFATGPSIMSVGEGRPERVDITPLSAATGRPSAGFGTGGAGGDKMQIDLNVNASEQLVVEVADQTMSEVADVFVQISQKGMQGGRGA
jgi:hypothetical protein